VLAELQTALLNCASREHLSGLADALVLPRHFSWAIWITLSWLVESTAIVKSAQSLHRPFGPALLAFCPIAIGAISYYTQRVSRGSSLHPAGWHRSVIVRWWLFTVSPNMSSAIARENSKGISMSPRIGNADCSQVLEAVGKLRREWERKIPSFARQGREPWAMSTLFAIEIAWHRIKEECAGSPMELNALIDQWEQLSSRREGGTAGESIRGIDFGIRLVVRRVRQCLNRPPQRKPPTSANGSHASLDHIGRKRGSQF
jgi:hypothetical protein